MARTVKKKKELTLEGKLAEALVPAEEQPYQVPENWCWTYLQSLCTIPITDGTHKTPSYCDPTEGVPFISAKDVTSGKICWKNIKYITPQLHEELYGRLAPQLNDVLLAKNGTTGIAAIVDVNMVFDLYVTIAVLRPNMDVVLPYYLLNVINSPACKNQFDSHLTGIGVPNLHLRDIKATCIPLPPLPEQQRIVDRIESLFSKLDEAKEKAQAVVDGFEDRKAAILHKAFTGELTEGWRTSCGIDRDWQKTIVGDHILLLSGQDFKPELYNSDNNGIPYITGASNFDQNHVIINRWTNSPTVIAQKNDVLLVCKGSGYGKTIIADFDEAHIARQIMALRVKPSVINTFLCYFLQSENEYLRRNGQGLIPGISRKVVLSMIISLPDVMEQKRIVDIIRVLFKKEQQAKEAAEQVISQIDTMKKSILARAFRGELSTNDPAEESAVELLKRIL